jgi:hypothetical protein
MIAGRVQKAPERRVGQGKRAGRRALDHALNGAAQKSRGHIFGGGYDQGGEMSDFRPREDVNAELRAREQVDATLWLGALDGPDGQVLREAFAKDRYLRAEVEAALVEQPAYLRSLLISHLARDLREHPDERPIRSFGRALIACLFDAERMRRVERRRRARGDEL